MANYQELLNRAVEALPENNGASRREVYEKARKALLAQLRSIEPPLPAREITQHRLELEDCIREVEHKATESLLGGLKDVEETSIPLAPEPEPEIVVEQPEVATPSVSEKPDESNSKEEQDSQKKKPQGDLDGQSEAKPDDEVESADKADPKQDAGNDKKAKGAADSKEQKATSGKDKKKSTDEKALEDSKEPSSEPDKKSNSQDESTAESDAPGSVDSSELDEIIARANSVGEGHVTKSGEKPVPSVSVSEEKTQKPVHRPSPKSDKSVGAAMSRVREVDNLSPDSEGEQNSTRAAQKAAMALNNAHTDYSANEADSGKSLADDLSAELANGSAPLDADAQLSIDRAIKTLDREARGESSAEEVSEGNAELSEALSAGETRLVLDESEEKSGNGLTIFLVIVILLLGAVGGGGYWAWKEGYIDLENLFSSSEATPDQTGDSQPAGDAQNADNQTGDSQGADSPASDTSSADTNANSDSAVEGPGNTTTSVRDVTLNDSDAVISGDDKTEDRLNPATDANGDAVTADGNNAASDGDTKVEDRLGADAVVPDASLGSQGDVDPNGATQAGPQSLLLEAATDGSGGAVPFSGTVEWSRGVDELGSPTLIGKASIPARNLNVQVLIRKNGDVSLPASHLMEIEFDVSETFAGGSVAGLPGILLKNEELVQGTALVGASARVVGNSFLFALSAAEQDQRANLDLLENQKWMDLALIYASGRRAIITLEKDDAAQTMFREVLATWNGESPTGEAAAAATESTVAPTQETSVPASNG